jgi:hypothetical protein
MIANDRVITLLADANPVAGTAPHGPQERADAERILHRVLSSPPSPRQRRPPTLVPAVSVLVVLVVVAVFLSVGGPSRRGASAGGGVQIVLRAEPTGQTPVVTPAVLSRTVRILRQRVRSVSRDARVTQLGANSVAVFVHDAAAGSRARILALSTTSARLYFYDWEANALTPNGKSVASQLQAQDPTALTISQGSSSSSPGAPGAGGLPLYQAVKLASEQPQAPTSSKLARRGAEYYMFAAPGSAACTAAAKANGTRPIRGAHCLLAGPDPNPRYLVSGLPAGVLATQGQQLVVKQGTVMLQAANPNASDQIKFDSPSAQFYVLKDNVSLFGGDITNPHQSTDQAGNPDVQFGFTFKGKTEFQNVTATIARRGDLFSALGRTLDQHFAVALDDELITVPSIDFRVYPDGIIGGGAADITAGFANQSASDLATELRLGPLPVNLVPVG